MITRSSIDRFAPWALVVAVCGPTLVGCGARPADGTPPPVVTVEAACHGADARVVADTVAAPVEQQVDGVERMVHMRSRSASDGTYRLDVTFERGVDLEQARVLVTNRVALAMPILPDAVRRGGVTVVKALPDVIAIVTVSSPDGRFDTRYLGKYAGDGLKNRLAGLPGVGEVGVFGLTPTDGRIWLDAEKLSARGVTAADVAMSLDDRRGPGPGGRPDRIPKGEAGDGPLTLTLADAESAGDVVVRRLGDGREVRLTDVARVEIGPSGRSRYASLDGGPVVALGIRPTREARPEVLGTTIRDEVSRLGPTLPEGLRVEVSVDLTPNPGYREQPLAPACLLVDVYPPDAASAERTIAILDRCRAILSGLEGVAGVLALSEHPFDLPGDRPCLLIRLAPAAAKPSVRDELVQVIRGRLNRGVTGAAFRVRDLSGPGRAPSRDFPIHLALLDADDVGHDALRARADELAEHLAHCPGLADVTVSRTSVSLPESLVEIDRIKLKSLEIHLDDVLATARAALGPVKVTASDTRRVTMRLPESDRLAGRGRGADVLLDLKVRAQGGHLVPLSAVLAVRDTVGPRTVERLDGRPMVEITAGLARGASLAEARARCERQALEFERPRGGRLVWLHKSSESK